jgi:hypothetical protein
MTTLTLGAIRNTVALLKAKNVKPVNGNYVVHVPLTPYTEQKFADFLGYGINSKNDWILVFNYGFAVGPLFPK